MFSDEDHAGGIGIVSKDKKVWCFWDCQVYKKSDHYSQKLQKKLKHENNPNQRYYLKQRIRGNKRLSRFEFPSGSQMKTKKI